MDTNKKIKNRNINEEALKEWLLTMGAGQQVLQDKVIRPACLGTLSQLWKQIITQIMPAQKCKQIRDNIFLQAVHKGKQGNCIQLNLQNKKKDLEEQKQFLLHKQKQQHEKLQSVLQNTIDNKTKLELAKQKLLNMRRKRVLLTELKEQIKCDIKHSENVSQVLSIYTHNNKSNNSTIKFNFIENEESVDVKNILNNVDMSELWENLILERQEIVNLLMKMATSINLPEEFAVVEKNTLKNYNARPWKDGIVDLNTIYLKIIFSTLKFQKDIERLNDEKNNLLKLKVNFNKTTEEQRELLKLSLQINSLKQNISSYKDFIQSLNYKKGVFCVDFEDNFDYNVDVADVRQEMAYFQKHFRDVEESIKNNLINIVEGVSKMKENRIQVLEILNRDSSNSDCSNKLANLFESVLSSNTSKRSLENNNLIDLKDKFTDLNILECVEKQHKILIDEVEFLKEFNLEANCKLILNNGSEMWFSETNAGRQIPQIDEINNLLPAFKNSTSTIRKYLNAKEWESNLGKLLTDFENIEKAEKEKSENINTLIEDDINSSDKIKKMAKSTIKNLQHVQDLCNRFDEKVKFFNDVKWKNYVSKTRLHNGLSYVEYEEKYKEFIRDMN